MKIATATPAASDENCFAGQVLDIGYLGDLSIYKVKLDNGFVMQAAVVNQSTAAGAADRLGRAGVAELRARVRRGADQMSGDAPANDASLGRVARRARSRRSGWPCSSSFRS